MTFDKRAYDERRYSMDKATTRNVPRLQLLVVITIIVMVGTFYISTIREGQGWADDFSMYIRHAMNIVEGKAYADTGYILNPYYPFLGPQAYPPVFPILLSPVYYWFGLNLQAMEVEIIFFFAAFLLIFWLTIKDELPFLQQVTIIAILGFSPYFWEFKEHVLSDIPFLLFAYIALLLVYRAKKAQLSQKVPTWLYAIFTGFIFYAAYGTRTIGAILLLSLLVYDLLTLRRLTSFTIIVTVSATLMILLQNVLLPSINTSYLSQFTIPRDDFYDKLHRYGQSILTILDNGHNPVIQLILFTILLGFAIVGYLVRCKKNITIYEIFVPLYVGMVLVWPAFQDRFLIPLVPLFVWYAFIGVNFIGVNAKYFQPVQGIILATLVLGIFGSYVGKYMTEDYGPIAIGINKRESIELFAYIRANTEKDAIIIFRRPRALALFTDRRALVFQPLESEDSTISYFREVGADYLINGPMDPSYLYAFIKGHEDCDKHADCFQQVYYNSDFQVYKIRYR
jgi:hypothetical protein